MSPQIHVGILTLKMMVLGGGALGSWLGHEDGALMSGMSVLRKETLEDQLTPSAKWGHSDRRPQKRVLTRSRPHWHPDLRLPASGTLRNTFLLLISHSVYDTLL